MTDFITEPDSLLFRVTRVDSIIHLFQTPKSQQIKSTETKNINIFLSEQN